jgi:hypothetical protein
MMQLIRLRMQWMLAVGAPLLGIANEVRRQMCLRTMACL